VKRQTLEVVLGLGISAVLIVVVLARVSLADVIDAIRQADYVYLGLCLLLLLLSYVLRALRWQAILWTIQQVRFWNAFRVYIIGCMANNVLPVRMGELVRAFLTGKTEKSSSSACLGAVAVERVFDVVILVFLLSVCGLFTGKMNSIGHTVWYVAGLAATLVVLLYILARSGEKLLSWVRLVIGRFSGPFADRIERLGSSFVSGLWAVRDGRRLGLVLGASMAVWLTVILEVRLALLAFDVSISWPATAFVLSVAGLGIVLPSSPGNLGAVEFFYVSALGLFQVNPSVALSCAMTLHALDWTAITLLGLIFLWQSDLSLGQIQRLTAREGFRPDSSAIENQGT
jgi:uncharacterized protein (TIRG00374 family)